LKTTLNIIIVIFLGLFTGSSFAQEYNKKDAQGRKQGKWIKTYEGKKNILYKGNFKDNRPRGLFVFYYETGKVKAKNTYFNDGYNSYASTYYENGKLMSTGKYVNQKKDSTWVYLDEWGNYISKDTYRRGEKYGRCIVFYPFNPKVDEGRPKIIEIANYVNGDRDGEYQKFFRNGKLLTEGTYSLGLFEGKVTTFYATGYKKNVTYYKHGVRNGYSINYDGVGKESSKRYLRKGHEIKGKELEDYLKRKKERAKKN
jgi:antitoxin component YwqK of YwqJK toxin-antitoxin module